MKRWIIAAMAVLTATSANGQLFVGVDDSSIHAKVGNVGDLSNVTYSDALGDIEIWGAAYDPAGHQLWLSGGIELYKSPVSGPAEFVANFSDGSAAISMTGLAWANGRLFGFRSVGTVGIYEVNPATGAATLALATPGFDFGGLDYNAANGLIYGTSDGSSSSTRGLFSIDVLGGGAITKIANYPAGQTDIDGLAVGDGKAWLVTDEPGSFFAYDLSQGPNGSYTSFASAWTTTSLFSAGAYIPEPGTLVMLLGAGLLATRRRSTR